MKSGFQKVIASLLIAIIMISTTSITVDSAATVGDIKDDYVRSGLDIVKQAASHLGRAYNGSFGSETDEKGNKSLRFPDITKAGAEDEPAEGEAEEK